MLAALIVIGVILAAGGVVLWGIGAAIGGVADAYHAQQHAKRMAEFDAWDKANPEAKAYWDFHGPHEESAWRASHPDD